MLGESPSPCVGGKCVLLLAFSGGTGKEALRGEKLLGGQCCLHVTLQMAGGQGEQGKSLCGSRSAKRAQGVKQHVHTHAHTHNLGYLCAI